MPVPRKRERVRYRVVGSRGQNCEPADNRRSDDPGRLLTPPQQHADAGERQHDEPPLTVRNRDVQREQATEKTAEVGRAADAIGLELARACEEVRQRRCEQDERADGHHEQPADRVP